MNRRTYGLVAAIAAAVALIAPATATARTPATGAKKTAIVSAILFAHEEPRPSLSQALRCLQRLDVSGLRVRGQPQIGGNRRNPCTQPGGYRVLDAVGDPAQHARALGRAPDHSKPTCLAAQLRRLRIPLSVFKNLTHQPMLCSPGDHRGCKPVPN